MGKDENAKALTASPQPPHGHTPPFMGQEKVEDILDRCQTFICGAKVSSRKSDASPVSGYLLAAKTALSRACSASKGRRQLCRFWFGWYLKAYSP